MVFDGELIRKNIDNLSDSENFRIGTGIINSDDTDKSCIEFVLFDCLPRGVSRRKKACEDMICFTIKKGRAPFNISAMMKLRLMVFLKEQNWGGRDLC